MAIRMRDYGRYDGREMGGDGMEMGKSEEGHTLKSGWRPGGNAGKSVAQLGSPLIAYTAQAKSESK